MKKVLDLKGRVVNYYSVDTGLVEDEIVSYLKRGMKVRFHGAKFNNSTYVFLGNASDKASNAITVSSYRKKAAGENVSVRIG